MTGLRPAAAGPALVHAALVDEVAAQRVHREGLPDFRAGRPRLLPTTTGRLDVVRERR